MDSPQLVIVGSLGIDDIATPTDKRQNLLGGSVSYAGVAASLFAATGAVAIAGTDLSQALLRRLCVHGLDVQGIQIREGKTFRWSGVYGTNMIDRRTLSTELGNSAGFSPDLPESYRDAPYLLLGNIQPDLQLHVLDQMRFLRFVALDTMNLWIETARTSLSRVLERVTMVSVNDEEARMLSGRWQLRDCARAILDMGPRYVAVKKGEHGSLLFSREGAIRIIPAYPVEAVVDPTGAGDSYAGAFMGRLAETGSDGSNLGELVEALLTGAVVSSFGVEAFGLDRLEALNLGEVEVRLSALKRMCALA